MQLFGDRILVKPIPHDETTPGGIALPDTARPKHYRSKVVQVGDGAPSLATMHSSASTLGGATLPLRVKPGDVVYHLAPGIDFNLGDQALKLLGEGDLFGKD